MFCFYLFADSVPAEPHSGSESQRAEPEIGGTPKPPSPEHGRGYSADLPLESSWNLMISHDLKNMFSGDWIIKYNCRLIMVNKRLWDDYIC